MTDPLEWKTIPLVPQVKFAVGEGWLYVGSGGWLFWQPESDLDVRIRVSWSELQERFVPVEVVVRMVDGAQVGAAVLRGLPLARADRMLADTTVAEVISRGFGRFDGPATALGDFSPWTCTTDQALERASAAEDRTDLWFRTDLRLEIPRRGKRGDDFYQLVHDLHRSISLTSHRPAADIAEANDVAITTVHGWLKEYRRRALRGAAGTEAPGAP